MKLSWFLSQFLCCFVAVDAMLPGIIRFSSFSPFFGNQFLASVFPRFMNWNKKKILLKVLSEIREHWRSNHTAKSLIRFVIHCWPVYRSCCTHSCALNHIYCMATAWLCWAHVRWFCIVFANSAKHLNDTMFIPTTLMCANGRASMWQCQFAIRPSRCNKIWWMPWKIVQTKFDFNSSPHCKSKIAVKFAHGNYKQDLHANKNWMFWPQRCAYSRISISSGNALKHSYNQWVESAQLEKETQA